MVAEAHDQNRIVGEIALQAAAELGVVAHADRLPAQVFVDVKPVAGQSPVRSEVRSPAKIPREVIGSGVDEHEQRPAPALEGQRTRGDVKIECIGIALARAEVFGIAKILDASGSLEAAGAKEGAGIGIHTDGLIAAAPQRARQAALDPSGRKPCDTLRETAVGTH